ncbi:Sua5/YciO/YrdC/YwlC family protein [Dasania sp. GY-MA-18]|uniref:L-threonylcarbamoyladenylate synthase n=1 Tax=Dasania phycosphaerae TaxID=2950436 RepID=A0A9J6RPG0_9GAMM|nr:MULTISPECIES: Sua5/YciO/YrdC/YwlC family protein [Dasania]MCR8923476.1 Sua5/YciO/YrdC/YwlC family protein [Dasania sp. GY-MA-18]MCZ0865909.1 Sua5/YciO/YrdC/YwlC family protein [Dasania phycosphaerae]MCZ0869634.1 Sua5/YciO/YrdC/YwlC family protein [Dasania phycosphaerae]
MNSEVENALKSIKNSGLCLIKADIGFGLVGHSEESMRKMYELKGRDLSNPAIIVGNLDVVDEISLIDSTTRQWIKDISSRTTLAVILPVNPESKMLKRLPKFVYKQATLNETVAIFLNTGKFLERLVNLAYQEEILLTGSSGNLSGRGNQYQIDDVGEAITEKVDYTYNEGACAYENSHRSATTIVNLALKNIRRVGVNHNLIKSEFIKYKEVQENASV